MLRSRKRSKNNQSSRRQKRGSRPCFRYRANNPVSGYVEGLIRDVVKSPAGREAAEEGRADRERLMREEARLRWELNKALISQEA